jgi:penicillin amidase
LHAPGLNVTGVSLPGVPCIVIGHNDRIAWGVTNLGFDVEDLYIEKLDPRTGQYLFRGHVEQARLESEQIAIKGARAEELRQWVTRHGPVNVSEGNQFMALRWAAGEPGSFQFPFLDVNKATNWAEFTRAIGRFPGPGQNFVYADVDGNIGYHATGRLPIRRNYDGDVPVDGSSGDYEWDGFIPFDQLPTFYNPPQGWIVTANQNPFPENYPYRVHGDFASPYRSTEIRSLLTAHDGWKPEDLVAVQKDVYSAFSHFLAKEVVAAFDRKKPSSVDAQAGAALLRGWNGQMEKGTAAPLLITAVYQQLKKMLVDRAAPGKADLYTMQMAPAVLERILSDDAHDWFQDKDEALMRALTKGVSDGRDQQGGDLNRWDYGAYNELTIKHPVGSQLPLLGSYFNVGPIPMSGSSTTIKQTTTRLGPSMRFVADLSGWDRSLNNLTIGESGQILSSHYKDQWNAYYSGRSFPMRFNQVDAKQTLTVRAR